MFRSKDEFKKIYDSMNKNYAESVKEYKKYIKENSSFYITRRKHMKHYIIKKLIENGYEITEQTQKALMQIARACKTYAIYKNDKDLFELLLLGDADIMYDYINTMSYLALSKDNKFLKVSAEVEMDELNKRIEEKIRKNKIQEASVAKKKNEGVEK